MARNLPELIFFISIWRSFQVESGIVIRLRLCLLCKLCGKFERLPCARRVALRNACVADHPPVCGLYTRLMSGEAVRFSSQCDCLRIQALVEAHLCKLKP